MTTYNYIRYFLSERSLPPLLEAAEYEIDQRTRTEYLNSELSKSFDFIHAGNSFRYVFISHDEEFVLARIGRLKTEQKLDGPETGFMEVSGDFWHAVNFIMDTSDHTQGQKIAMEHDSSVGSVLAIAKSLAAHLNSLPESKWEVAANPITTQKTFWSAAEEYRGRITDLQMTFVAPNILGGTDETTEALRRWRDELKMRETQLNFKNSDGGLEIENQSVRDGIAVISEGGGATKLKSGTSVIYDSQNDEVAKSETVENELNFPLVQSTINGWRLLIARLFND